jgi:ABC-2 type transport system ATP-binding protein
VSFTNQSKGPKRVSESLTISAPDVRRPRVDDGGPDAALPGADVAVNAVRPQPGIARAAIQTRNLGKSFGSRVALESIDLEVPRGCAFGFLGANGAGKTTLIRLLLGLAEPTSGDMCVLGHNMPRGRAAALARVGAIIEEPRFHPHLTGRENLNVHAAARERSAHDRVDSALARVGLASRGGDKVKSYSLGMRQRLGVARCLLADPELLILDEPMNGLDPAGMLEFRQLIREFVAEGRTVLLSSHLLDEVEKTCDVAAIVDRGRVVAQGSIDELRRNGSRVIEIGCRNRRQAAALVAHTPSVRSADECEDGLRVTLRADAPPDALVVTEMLRTLLDRNIAIERVSPITSSLEDLFLTMTTRLEDR